MKIALISLVVAAAIALTMADSESGFHRLYCHFEDESFQSRHAAMIASLSEMPGITSSNPKMWESRLHLMNVHNPHDPNETYEDFFNYTVYQINTWDQASCQFRFFQFFPRPPASNPARPAYAISHIAVAVEAPYFRSTHSGSGREEAHATYHITYLNPIIPDIDATTGGTNYFSTATSDVTVVGEFVSNTTGASVLSEVVTVLEYQKHRYYSESVANTYFYTITGIIPQGTVGWLWFDSLAVDRGTNPSYAPGDIQTCYNRFLNGQTTRVLDPNVPASLTYAQGGPYPRQYTIDYCDPAASV